MKAMKVNLTEQELGFVRSVLGDCLTLFNDILGSEVEEELIDCNDKAFLSDINTAYDLVSKGLEKN